VRLSDVESRKKEIGRRGGRFELLMVEKEWATKQMYVQIKGE